MHGAAQQGVVQVPMQPRHVLQEATERTVMLWNASAAWLLT